MVDPEHDVFISHNRADKPWVRSLAARIERESWNGRQLKVFFDEWDIEPGENIPIALETALVKSRKVAVVLSPDAAQSAWVATERSFCSAIDPLNRHLRVIPLMLRGTEADIPPFVRALKYIDFREGHCDFEESMEGLLRVLREERSPRSSPSRQVDPVTVGSSLATVLMRDARNRCSICHTSFDVKLFPITPGHGSKNSSAQNIIPLCESCHIRVRDENLTPEQLATVKKAWLMVCASGHDLDDPNSRPEDYYREACRLSLSPDPIDIKRAIVFCRLALAHQPFHADAQILLDKLIPIDRRLDERVSHRDVRYHLRGGETGDAARWAIIAFSVTLGLNITLMVFKMFTLAPGQQKSLFLQGVLPWVIVFGLFAFSAVFRRLIIFHINWLAIHIHESGHIHALYRLHPIKNALGQKLPLKDYYKYLELEIDGKYQMGGRNVALRHYLRTGIFPGVCLNQSKMSREWYGTFSL